jgi:hypothetical protein
MMMGKMQRLEAERAATSCEIETTSEEEEATGRKLKPLEATRLCDKKFYQKYRTRSCGGSSRTPGALPHIRCARTRLTQSLGGSSSAGGAARHDQRRRLAARPKGGTEKGLGGSAGGVVRDRIVEIAARQIGLSMKGRFLVSPKGLIAIPKFGEQAVHVSTERGQRAEL